MNLLSPDTQSSRAYLSYVGPEWGVSTGAWTFLVPEGLPITRIRVKHDLPQNWSMVAPWEPGQSELVTENLDAFAAATYTVGPFDIRDYRTDGTRLTLAIYSPWDESVRTRTRSLLQEAWRYMVADVFRATPRMWHTAAVFPPTEAGYGIFRLEGPDSQAFSGRPNDLLWLTLQFSHRVFHIYLGWPPDAAGRASAAEMWIVEGVNTYYNAGKVPKAVGLTEDVTEGLARHYARYQGFLGGPQDRPVGSAEAIRVPGPDGNLLPYGKGALVAYLLDSLMGNVTQNRIGVDDLVRQLFQQFGNQKRPIYGQDRSRRFSNADTLALVNRLTGRSFSPFFDRYVFGNESLPLSAQGNRLAIDLDRLRTAVR
jgi:hypothetical protein